MFPNINCRNIDFCCAKDNWKSPYQRKHFCKKSKEINNIIKFDSSSLEVQDPGDNKNYLFLILSNH